MNVNSPFQELEARLPHSFKNGELLKAALTHRSFSFENKGEAGSHFERLEFLGDAVLGLVISESLMEHFPEADEGLLSKLRASLVNEQSLNDLAQKLNLKPFIRLGKSEELQRELSLSRPRMMASVFEALIGALYLDGGLEVVRSFLKREFAQMMEKIDLNFVFAQDFKTRLQEFAQKRWRKLPEYRWLASNGPEHSKVFQYEVTIESEIYGQGEGSSRKSAEQMAAKNALVKLGVLT